MDFQKEFDKLVTFTPLSAVTTRNNSDGSYFYFGAIIRNGAIDTEKYPNGRKRSADEILSDELFIRFKKLTKKDGSVVLYLREVFLNDAFNLENNYLMYKYLEENCLLE